MHTISYKPKLIIGAIVFAVGMAVMFLLVVPQLQATLLSRQAKILDQKKTVLELRQERDNLERAKNDLEELTGKVLQPNDFFSKDTTLVSELARLEDRAKKMKVDLSLTVSGTVAAATKAKTTSELYVVPITLRLSGAYADVVGYIDFLEHFSTIFTVRSITVATSTKDTVNANLTATVYLRK